MATQQQSGISGGTLSLQPSLADEIGRLCFPGRGSGHGVSQRAGEVRSVLIVLSGNQSIGIEIRSRYSKFFGNV